MQRGVKAVKIFKNQRGDTIMEVLIAVAVLSLVLSAAFALANQSSQANTQAGERSESAKITESQIEQLKSFIGESAAPVIPADGYFCMYQETVGAGPQKVLKTKAVSSSAITADDFNAYPVECKSPTVPGEFYNTYIQKVGNTYTAHTRWYAASGNGVDETTMVYRVYPDIAGNQTGSTLLLGCNAPSQYMNSLGGCEPCAPGYQNLLGGFSMVPCTAITPTITVIVQKVPPAAGNNTPSCSSAGNNANGVSVQLTGNSQTSSGTSTATFSNLAFLKTYTASVSGMPAGFSFCPPPNSTTTETTKAEGNYPGANKTLSLKIIPNCYAVTKYGPPYYHNVYWHDHGYDYPVYVWGRPHIGPDGYYGRWPFFFPNGYAQAEGAAGGYTDPETGSNLVWTEYHWPGAPANVDWRNRFEWRKYFSHMEHYYNWHLHEEDYRGDPYLENVCPT